MFTWKAKLHEMLCFGECILNWAIFILYVYFTSVFCLKSLCSSLTIVWKTWLFPFCFYISASLSLSGSVSRCWILRRGPYGGSFMGSRCCYHHSGNRGMQHQWDDNTGGLQPSQSMLFACVCVCVRARAYDLWQVSCLYKGWFISPMVAIY